jgi:predicted HicB family RNase H-like nuclease
MNAMTYKDYAARVEFDADDHIFVGRVIGIRDIVTFHGETVRELENSFKEAVDDYLEACATIGQQPNKPYSGKILIRVSAEIHAAVAASAESAGKSLNQWAAETLKKAANV